MEVSMSSFIRNNVKSPALVAAAVLAGIAGAGILVSGHVVNAGESAFVIPAPAMDEATPGDGLEKAVVAGGCFWGVQAIFQHTDGVETAVSGYAGGDKPDPTYRQVSSGATGHAEAVEITYDPAKISYGKLLQIFFSVAHDPTQLNRQGPDVGTQYRSAIFATSDEQRDVAEAYVAQLQETGVYPGEIVTEIAPLATFYKAEDYHQDYATIHPDQPYIVWNDKPKVENMKAMFPDIWRDDPKLVFAENANS
jgi:peptide-methionine (S)-S-oxide reductase